MNNGGDAAEQIVRLSLEGIEVAARLSGTAAKHVAVLLVAVLKEEKKTQGKARLTNMIKSGKSLSVFSVPQKDLKKFTAEAKRYGVLYCVLRDKSVKGDNVQVDIISRAEDAAKIQRIMERFELGTVETVQIVNEVERDMTTRSEKAKEQPEKSRGEIIAEEALRDPSERTGRGQANPEAAKTEKDLPSRQGSEQVSMPSKREGVSKTEQKPSVKEKLRNYKEVAKGREQSPLATNMKKKEKVR